MRLLSILPIARGIRLEILTYFSAKDIPVGTLVSIPLRKKVVPGIIIESEDALQNKSAIKGMDFSIKKIIQHKNDTSLPLWLMSASKKIAEASATSVGGVIASILPKICLEQPEIFFQQKKDKTNNKEHFESLAIQSSEDERFDTYKSIIRESFAKKKSVAVILPTIESVKNISENLSKGISDYVALLTNTSSKKNLKNFVEKSHNDTHPMLIIGTFQALSLLPSSIGTLILEEESSRFYKSQRQPFLDAKIVACEIARSLGIRYIVGDKLLSVETLASIKSGAINEYSRISKRNTHKIQTLLVDMKSETSLETESKIVPTDINKKDFVILSHDLKEMIIYSVKAKKKIFIYSVRRGIAPQTVCRDCSTTVTCHQCESPVVLHAKNNERKFICHHCGASRSALETCKLCGSWNLIPLGIGIERIEEEIKKITDAPITRIDSDNCKTAKEAKDKIEKFLTSPEGRIIIGTDLALRFLSEQTVDFSAIVSLDSLFSLPDFRTTERVMHTILDVKSKAIECMILQTRDTKQKVIENALSGDLESFVKDEISARKVFGYPPFVKIVKLTVVGTKEKVKEDASLVAEKLKEYKPVVFPAFIKSIKGKTSLHIMIKIPVNEWPDKALSNLLLSFPPSVKIDTSPLSLL